MRVVLTAEFKINQYKGIYINKDILFVVLFYYKKLFFFYIIIIISTNTHTMNNNIKTLRSI